MCDKNNGHSIKKENIINDEYLAVFIISRNKGIHIFVKNKHPSSVCCVSVLGECIYSAGVHQDNNIWYVFWIGSFEMLGGGSSSNTK